jgi:pimeloyl-ACP methyl ester carboxylesterase
MHDVVEPLPWRLVALSICGAIRGQHVGLPLVPTIRPTMTSTPQLLEFTTADGLRLVADAWGDPSARPVLLQHGGGQTRHSWGSTAADLAAAGWRAISLDLRGHGDSQWDPQEDYGLDAYARDTRAVLSQLNRPTVVVGASLGGLAALRAHGTGAAELFAALILVDVTPTLDRSGAERILQFMGARLADGFADLDEVADSIAAYMPHRRRPANLEGLKKNLRLGADGRYRWHWDPAFVTSRRRVSGAERDPLIAASRDLRIPTLLVRGRMSDIVTLETAREFLELVPHAEFVDVSGAGHMVAGDSNDVFCDAVLRFLGRPGPP